MSSTIVCLKFRPPFRKGTPSLWPLYDFRSNHSCRHHFEQSIPRDEWDEGSKPFKLTQYRHSKPVNWRSHVEELAILLIEYTDLSSR